MANEPKIRGKPARVPANLSEQRKERIHKLRDLLLRGKTMTEIIKELQISDCQAYKDRKLAAAMAADDFDGFDQAERAGAIIARLEHDILRYVDLAEHGVPVTTKDGKVERRPFDQDSVKLGYHRLALQAQQALIGFYLDTGLIQKAPDTININEGGIPLEIMRDPEVQAAFLKVMVMVRRKAETPGGSHK